MLACKSFWIQGKLAGLLPVESRHHRALLSGPTDFSRIAKLWPSSLTVVYATLPFYLVPSIAVSMTAPMAHGKKFSEVGRTALNGACPINIEEKKALTSHLSIVLPIKARENLTTVWDQTHP